MNPTSVTYARFTIVGAGFFFIVMFVAFPFIQPELDPLERWGSEYAAGRLGSLMVTAFAFLAIGVAALGLGLAAGLDPEARSRAGNVLLLVAAVGFLGSGVFVTDLQVLNENPPPRWVEPPPSPEMIGHLLSSLVAFLGLLPAAGLISRRLRLAGRLRGGYRWLRILAWAMPLGLLAVMFYFEPRGIEGLGQRIFIAMMLAWLLIAAQGLRKGAFGPTSA